MPLQETSGTASYDGFGGGAPAIPNYIEDVFSTWLYTGNGSAQGINNGIDLWTKGGMVWIKDRTTANSHAIFDTNRGAYNYLSSDTTSAQAFSTTTLSTFSSDGAGAPGFFVRSNVLVGSSGDNYASWTFRKQPKFFDVVTYTGTGSAQTIAHNLGSTPGCIIVKGTSSVSSWRVYHTSLGNTQSAQLDSTAVPVTSAGYWNNTSPTSTQFTVGTNGNVNDVGQTYVAYIFAHNAGGFGLTGTDNVISCGSVVSSASGPVEVNLGYEPQWILYKQSSATSDWYITDNMRGWTASYQEQLLRPNNSSAESAGGNMRPTATGFSIDPGGAVTWIYIAIRRGPMKTPTSGTSVFSPVVSASAVGTATTTNFPVDMQIFTATGVSDNRSVVDRLRGVNTTSTLSSLPRLNTINTDAEASSTLYSNNWGSTGFGIPGANASVSSVYWNFRRAPGFFDEVCYTGTGSLTAYNHNLGVVPELVIVKSRSTTYDWYVIQQPAGGGTGPELLLNTSGASLGSVNWSSIANATTFTPYSFYGTPTGASGQTYVAYLFASCPGVSKVGSYTGNGTTQTINCGFTGGARFVLIKRTDASGDWYVYDTARGMTTLTDPYLLLNSTAAQSATLGSVTSVTGGFALNASILAAINTNAASYIFLAIA